LIQDSNSPTADDKTGGFHEEYAVAGRNEYGDWSISKDKPGAYANPDTNTVVTPSGVPRDQNLANSITDPQVFAHAHPSGVTAAGNGWKQPPSGQDKSVALPGVINIVFAAREGKVYFYNSAGVIGKPMKLKDFLP
jgi:hypothetical protein